MWTTNFKTVVLISLFLVGMVSTATGEIIYVDDDAAGANDGSSWTDAYTEFQSALDMSMSGDQIWVAEGIYKPDEDTLHPTGTGNREATFKLKNVVAIYGGFAGGETSLEQRDWEANETILSGDLAGNDVHVNDPNDLPTEPTRAENSFHVVTGSGTNATAVIDGFTISAGNANSSYPYNKGGGMYNYEGSTTVTNCTFTENSAGYVGGGMCNDWNSSPTVTKSTFTENSADRDGGGMCNASNSSPIVEGCTFNGNSANRWGGGLKNEESRPKVEGCTFSGNSAKYKGGGMYNRDSSPTVKGCTFSGNSAGFVGGGMSNIKSSPMVTDCSFTANSAYSYGGGMENEHSSPVVEGCTFSGNSADDGGGMLNHESSPNVVNCTFSQNSANDDGGGMHNVFESSPNVYNCTFSQNSAEFGGGMYNNVSRPMVEGCTFSANSSTKGGGMSNWYTRPTVTNCTFSKNSAGLGGGMFNHSSSPTVNNCTFTANSAELHGGGMHNHDRSKPTVTNCTFAGNSAPNGSALACDSRNQQYPTNFQMTNCIFWDGGNEIWNNDNSDIAITYSDVQDGYPGEGNINADPLFVCGPLGDFYLSQVAAGQLVDSPCVDAGSDLASIFGLDQLTTCTDHEGDTGIVDMGYHYVPPPVIEVAVDIKPGSCPNPLNVKSKGVLPVAILGTEDVNVITIDPTSIRLAGVEPLRSGYEDVAGPVSESNDCNCMTEGPDGFLDLTLKFKTQRIVEAAGDVNDGDELQLELIGVLFDETPIEGADCILIRGRHKSLNPADINKDGVVNAADFAIFTQNWRRLPGLQGPCQASVEHDVTVPCFITPRLERR